MILELKVSKLKLEAKKGTLPIFYCRTFLFAKVAFDFYINSVVLFKSQNVGIKCSPLNMTLFLLPP